ncbi:MAG: hypothetical protein AAGA30_06490, partial [Planctomycetota bacterium]
MFNSSSPAASKVVGGVLASTRGFDHQTGRLGSGRKLAKVLQTNETRPPVSASWPEKQHYILQRMTSLPQIYPGPIHGEFERVVQ